MKGDALPVGLRVTRGSVFTLCQIGIYTISDRDLANTDQDFIKADFQISLRAGHRVADDLTVSNEYYSFYCHCKY